MFRVLNVRETLRKKKHKSRVTHRFCAYSILVNIPDLQVNGLIAVCFDQMPSAVVRNDQQIRSKIFSFFFFFKEFDLGVEHQVPIP